MKFEKTRRYDLSRLLSQILLIVVMTIPAFSVFVRAGFAQQIVTKPKTNKVVIELFYRGDSDQSLNAKKYLEELVKRRPGIEAKTYDVMEDRDQLRRLWKLSKRFGLEKAMAPSFYLCGRLRVGFPDEVKGGAQVEDLLTIKAFVRPGCQHCTEGKVFLNDLIRRWPALKVQYLDVVADYNARQEAQELTTRFRVQVPSFPCIKVAGSLIVGFQSAGTTGAKIEAFFKDRSVEFPKKDPPQTIDSDSDSDSGKDKEGKQSPSTQPTVDPSKSGSNLRSNRWFQYVGFPLSSSLTAILGDGGRQDQEVIKKKRR